MAPNDAVGDGERAGSSEGTRGSSSSSNGGAGGLLRRSGSTTTATPSNGSSERSPSRPVRAHPGIRAILQRNTQFTSDRGLAKNALASMCMGILLMLGLTCTVLSLRGVFEARAVSSTFVFGLYATALAAFHIMEFFMTALFHADTLDYSAWIISHSKPFTIAYIVCFVEFWIEWLIFPNLKQYFQWVTVLGLALVIFGQVLRTVAMYTAGTNFTHLVAEYKRRNHRLVTSGVYAFSRHPAYCGWFWWSTGIAFMTANPLCMIGYPFAAWQFFDARIPYEEDNLMHFFGLEYETYRERVPTRIPFMK